MRINPPGTAKAKEPVAEEHSDTFGKYIVYVDESGDLCMQSINALYPLFVLAFCVIDKRPVQEVQGKWLNPYHIALRFCLETLYDFLKEKNGEYNLTHIVVEQLGRKEDDELDWSSAGSATATMHARRATRLGFFFQIRKSYHRVFNSLIWRRDVVV